MFRNVSFPGKWFLSNELYNVFQPKVGSYSIHKKIGLGLQPTYRNAQEVCYYLKLMISGKVWTTEKLLYAFDAKTKVIVNEIDNTLYLI